MCVCVHYCVYLYTQYTMCIFLYIYIYKTNIIPNLTGQQPGKFL